MNAIFKFLGVATSVTASSSSPGSATVAVPKSIFDFTVEGPSGNVVSLETYKGKDAYLVVNVASQ